MQESGSQEAPSRRQFANYYVIFRWCIIYQVKSKPCSQCLSSLALRNTIFRVLLTFSSTRAVEAANSSRAPTE